MWNRNQPYGKTDVETGSRPLYPMMLESPELRWSFIRKVYVIIALQLLATIAVGAVVVTVRPISTFFATTGAGLALYIVLIFVPFISALPLSLTLISFNFDSIFFFFVEFSSNLLLILQRCVHFTIIIRRIRLITFFLRFSLSRFLLLLD